MVKSFRKYTLIIILPLLVANLFQLLFWDETLDQFRERFIKKTPTLPNTNITQGAFIVNGVELKSFSEEDFEEINTAIRNRVNEDPDLRQLRDEGKDLYEQAEQIEKRIDFLIKKTSKELYKILSFHGIK